ncbi:hypothetical protein IFU23_05755 [Pantoea agglomerans]|uniref:Uncharacterized protein n=1 Tax=Enterobacter agglomerans TaxID=549 RepID=A0ACC5PV47_ENTAG|nr:hypothetical protein [Pantoea agglomerans]MBD8129001.1 hypothetical protein [Pantoea agglomerans]MBD8152272.1 hypothetical protein [Pantoea agglomerans]MBD8157611.1 hypothetical protein [Pantoea agglomerans]MBD8231450.1 hypothetical protein [Pantoea agglomerans]MBD8241857.1 hypothetical protein [Pantoea agglomerans]
MKKILFVMALCAVAAGCTDASRSKFTAFGSPHEVQCWNYHQEIYHGISTGRVSHDKEGSSDTISFEDADTHQLVEIMLGQSSTCVIKVKP